jgi:hypothetical protein
MAPVLAPVQTVRRVGDGGRPRPGLRPGLRPDLRPGLRPDLRPGLRPDLRIGKAMPAEWSASARRATRARRLSHCCCGILLPASVGTGIATRLQHGNRKAVMDYTPTTPQRKTEHPARFRWMQRHGHGSRRDRGQP